MKMLKLVTSVASTNTYILYNESDCVIDPGDNAPFLFATLEENGLKCKFVLLTHAHFDHCNVARFCSQTGQKYLCMRETNRFCVRIKILR